MRKNQHKEKFIFLPAAISRRDACDHIFLTQLKAFVLYNVPRADIFSSSLKLHTAPRQKLLFQTESWKWISIQLCCATNEGNETENKAEETKQSKL